MLNNDNQFFDVAMISVLSFRFHPKNDESRSTVEEEVRFAAQVAQVALRVRNEVLRKDG